MRDLVLMPEYEPTDEELCILIHNVASEATYKAMNAKKQLRESIAKQIQVTHIKYQIHLMKKLD